MITDDNGRFILLDTTIDNCDVTIINIYAPTKDKESEQIEFLNFLYESLLDYGDKNIILGGDFNVCLNPLLDKKGGVKEDISKYATSLYEMMEEFNLIDAWRIINPDAKKFTWRGNTRQGLVQSRLDYILASAHMLYELKLTDISPGVRSDHSLVKIVFKINTGQTRGRGFWKFNSSLLKEGEYIKRIKDTLNNCSEKYRDFENKGLLWDAIKCEFRADTISYSCWKAKQTTEKLNTLNERLEMLEGELNNGNQNIINQYKETKASLENLLEEKSRGIFIRSRAQYIEQGEKCTKYFLNKEKSNSKVKHIKCLITDTDTINDPQEILREQKIFYQKLYTDNTLKNCDDDCEFFNHTFPELSQEELDHCDKELTIEEIGKGLKDLPNNKAPGTDGFTADFYKFFWPDIKTYVYNSFMYAFDTGKLSVEQRRAILTLLPKGEKDIRYLKNWRPLSLLNTDYKILTKTLATRLQKVIPKLVSPDQTGCVKGRYIGENIRILFDVLEYTSKQNISGVIAFLDFEKAFDSVSWKFLKKSLEKFNFGPYFRKWVNIIYNEPESAVINNGHASEFFTLTRGIRQGCPISALLFIIVAEVMAINIRNEKSIKGLNIGTTNIKLTQYADDTTLYLQDTESLKCTFKLLDKFQLYAGLKLNKEKTEAIQLGLMQQNLQDNRIGIKWIVDSTKALGVWVGRDVNLAVAKNLDEKLTKVKNLLNMYKSRTITIKGKITVLRSTVLPLILYVASVIPVSTIFITEAEKAFYDFVWPSGKHHVKKNVLIQPIENGGLKMPDLDSMIKAIKMTWITRLINEKCNIKIIAQEVTGIKDFRDFLKYKFNETHTVQLPLFYKQIMQYWIEIHGTEPLCTNDILNEHLWFNRYIIVGEKTVFYKQWNQKSINMVQDVIDNNGKPLSIGELQLKYGIMIDVMKYNSLISAIPKQWLLALKGNQNELYNFKKHDCIMVRINKSLKDVSVLKCKDFYGHLIEKRYVIPTCRAKWQNHYPEVIFDWDSIYLLPYEVARETALHSFQYRLLNRYLPCKVALKKWKIEENDLCNECNEIDTLEHFLVQCIKLKPFWDSLLEWWNSIYEVTIKLQTLDIVVGMANTDRDITLNTLNFCMLYAKYYIYKCKTNTKDVIFEIYKAELKQRLEFEKIILLQEGKLDVYTKKWKLLDESL